jgi:hypothetical protein
LTWWMGWKLEDITMKEVGNVETGVYENLMTAGVIDPTKVARYALQNTSSVASLPITKPWWGPGTWEQSPMSPMGGGMGGDLLRYSGQMFGREG